MITRLPEAGRWMRRLARGVDPLQLMIVQRALADVGVCEEPAGSNRGPEIDEYVKNSGSPLGSFWCACAVRQWFWDAGAKVPPSAAGSCDTWVSWAKANSLWSLKPTFGAAVVYHAANNKLDANHIGIVVRLDLLLSVEGNTTVGGDYNRNGVAVDLKAVNKPRVMGYVYPTER